MIKRKTLPMERLHELFSYDPETGVVSWRILDRRISPGTVAGSVYKDGYLWVSIMGKLFAVHRVAYALHNGQWPVCDIDHANRVKTDNRACNIREVSASQNQANRTLQVSSKTGYKGVCFLPKRGKWMAKIQWQGRRKHLGTFGTPEDAANAYDEAALQTFGKYAVTNAAIAAAPSATSEGGEVDRG